MDLKTKAAVTSCAPNYSYEKDRLNSFDKWEAHFAVDASRLAKAGFYYTGNKDEVVCFSCQGHIKDWNYGDVVQEKHSELFPNCDFVNGRSNNVPLVQMKKESNKGDLKHSANNCDVSLPHILSKVDYDKMKSLSERIDTYTEWPLKNINVLNLAKAGFFYLGCEDKVQCAFCKGIVSSWETEDDPFEEHYKHFPTCTFLSEHLSDKHLKGVPWFLTESEDLCGNMKKTVNPSKCKLLDETQEHADLKKLGVHLHSNPAHPLKATLNARINSFAKWPASALVSKYDLAKAGFFYLGISDHTKCFHCNGGLCNWEHGDDPWFEHARWFRNCDFLRLNKGENFIESVVKKCHSTKPQFELQSNCLWPEPLILLVDEAMKSELVKKVLETGLFPPYVVRAAILRQIKETGNSFSSEEDLCIAVSYLKEEMETEPLKMNDCHSSESNAQNLSSDLRVHHIDFQKCAISVEDGSNGKTEIGKTTVSPSGILKLNSKLKSDPSDLQKDQCLCKICMDNEVGVVFLPCGHLLACVECAPALELCPMCRKTIQATVRAYLP